MNKILLSLSFLMISLAVTAQKVYFIYLQSESGQPFFAKINNQVRSSSASGYLILSKLRDSTYSFSVGFPQNKWPEQNFSVAINKKDHGYLLKNFGEKGWGLFDLQTLDVQMAVSSKPGAMIRVENNDGSAFTNALSKASNDPSLNERPVQPVTEEKKPEVKETVAAAPVPETEKTTAKKEETKPEIKETVAEKPAAIVEQPIAKQEDPKEEPKTIVADKPGAVTEPAITKKEDSVIEIKEKSVAQDGGDVIPEEEYKRSTVTKKSESSTTEGFGLVYIDNHANGSTDTIRLLIPNPKPIAGIIKEEPKEEKRFLDIAPNENVKEEKKEEVAAAGNDKSVEKAVNKNNCTVMAEESDFFKLRRIMAATEKEEDMIVEANKYFKAKCFTTAQVKNLSTLFLNDESKYHFLDAAYTHTSDAQNYPSLQSELKEEYYINRFKAMLRN